MKPWHDFFRYEPDTGLLYWRIDWGKKIKADVWHDGKNHYLGLFPLFDVAVAARRAAQEKLGFHVNHGMAR